MNMKKRQLGVSLSGLLMSAVILAVIALLGMKVVPEYIEYFQIVKTLKAVSSDSKAQGTVSEVRSAFERRATIDNITAIAPSDLDVTKDSGGLVISFAYERRIPLFSNVSLLLDFQGSNKE
jgi:hypothetical protein